MLTAALSGFDPENFLREYWQRKPLLIRQAISPEHFPLEPEELAGLACEEAVESRLIRGNLQTGFALQHGPIDEALFPTLPSTDWTVLVQAVDQYVPEVAQLLNYFRFIPNWRIDDIMVSYAAPGGSAGPHFDHYDVFLIQGRGTRRWQLGGLVEQQPPLIAHEELQLLSQFEAVDEWELQPGDMLYLPPRFAHWGVSTSTDCMTYSVGFRSPTVAELLSECCDQAILNLDDAQRYSDPELQSAQQQPGALQQQTLDKLQALVLDALSDKKQFRAWMGRYLTQPKYLVADSSTDSDPLEPPYSLEALRQALQNAYLVVRDSATRLAYHQDDNTIHLFINGSHHPMTADDAELVKTLCDAPSPSAELLLKALADEELAGLILALFTTGSLYFADELSH